MNRRGFFKTIAAATAGFTILPPATTYDRVWRATKQINPMFIFNPMNLKGEWKVIYGDVLGSPCDKSDFVETA